MMTRKALPGEPFFFWIVIAFFSKSVILDTVRVIMTRILGIEICH